MTQNRRTFVKRAAGIAALSTVGTAGCMGTASAKTGTLSTRVSDRPGDIDDFESCLVTLSTVRIKPTDGDAKELDVSDTEVDLVDLQGDASALVADSEVDAGDYEFLQLEVSNTDATLTDGSDATVEVPGSAPLKFEKSFEIRADETTTFTADFTPVKTGNAGKYVIQPVAEEVSVVYESDDSTANETETTASNTTSTTKETATTNTTSE
ncbi:MULTISPECIES: DUF4382 domain-containing protein [Haloferax]|uniref:DUF4382 domain-containing protein n=2 Tax=Haloferax TaxID=2251 RepID=A0A6G1Z286_9EURY|nr:MULTISPECIES: DUF4382 domain-containing protein [Haloferax]KAB1187973.1 DUF4382 domain-containing protein [Haloferax sp. CBA1149]MRW80642.1 DUF4382 domain-containing protein [Haloferax marinisediminis]